MKHHRIEKAKREHLESLTASERIGVWFYQHMASMACVYLFTGIGIASLYGAITGNVLLSAVFGATSSYFIQLVSLPLIMIGQRVEGRESDHKLSEVLADLEEIRSSSFIRSGDNIRIIE